MQKQSEDLYYKAFSFLFLSAIFFLLRLDTFKFVYDGVFLKLIDPDSYYHLRRILFTIKNYPAVLNYDSFLSYPFGDYVPWPPLFDFLSATISLIFKNTQFILPALDMVYFFSAFSIIYFCVLKEYGSIPTVIIAFFLSVSGILRVYTSFGRLDHHALELLIITGIYSTFFIYCKKKNLLLLAFFTLAIISAFFNWPGAVIYFPPMVLFVFYKLYKNDIDKQIFKGLFVAFHITAILIAIYLRFTKSQDFPPYSYKFLSGFQRDFCFFVSIVFFNVYLSLKTKINRVLIWATALIILSVAFHKFIFELFTGFSFVGKLQPEFLLIEESSPLFLSKFYTFGEQLKRAYSLFTPFFFLAPIVFYKYLKNRGLDIVFIYVVYFLTLTLFQLRFGYFFMLGYAVMLGVFLHPFVSLFKKSLVYLFIAVISTILFFTYYREAPSRFENKAIYEALHFLNEITPEKKEFEFGKTPYGVLASWHLGHYIIQLGNRPAVAHNFIGVSKNNDVKAFINALFAETEDQVVRIMKEKKAKFLLLEDPKTSLITDWRVINTAPNPYLKNNLELNNKVYNLFLYRLYYFNGITPPFNQTTKYFRLVYDNDGIKIFELVDGFTVNTKGDKGDYILKAKIATPKNSFFYISVGDTNKNGKTFTIPYTLNAPYPVKAVEIYLEKDGKKFPITVTEEALN